MNHVRMRQAVNAMSALLAGGLTALNVLEIAKIARYFDAAGVLRECDNVIVDKKWLQRCLLVYDSRDVLLVNCQWPS